MKVRHLVVVIIVFIIELVSYTQSASADEPIPITLSGGMNHVIFDGKWSFFTEWKPSSLNTLSYGDGTTIQLRTAHQDNFIYVFADVVTDTHFVKGSDTAMICFDENDNKTVLPDADDYCFMTTLGGNKSFAYQGGSPLEFNGNFKKIPNPDGFIGVGGISDKNDRYSLVPHSGYEFRIPTSTVGRSSSYGFYFAMYDAHASKFYTYPQDVNIDTPFQIPSPSLWGDLISPDQSLPEFPLPAIVLVFAFAVVFFFRKKCLVFYDR